MIVTFSNESKDYLNKLVFILISKHYFSIQSTAVKYVEKLYDYSYTYIPLLPGKKTPERFKKYGRDLHYIAYRPNKQTTWYIFYIQKNDRFIVTYITNNHVNAHHIRGLR